MSLAQSARQRNLNLTFYQLVESRLAALYGSAYADRTFFNDAMADPTALDERETPLGQWFHVRYVSAGLGLKLPTIFQIDCYTSVGTDITPLDRYGSVATQHADKLKAALSVADVGVTIKDFSVDPNNPTPTGDWFLIRNSRGQQGWPDAGRPIPANRGLAIESLTVHVWHAQDLHAGVQLYF